MPETATRASTWPPSVTTWMEPECDKLIMESLRQELHRHRGVPRHQRAPGTEQ